MTTSEMKARRILEYLKAKLAMIDVTGKRSGRCKISVKYEYAIIRLC